MQIGVLWWWWWSLQWLIGKCVSSCFGHHFLKDVCPFTLIVYMIQKTLIGLKGWNIIMCHYLCELKKKFVSPHVRNIILFCSFLWIEKNHLWTHKCAISFFSFLVWVKKTKCAISFFSFLVRVKKTKCAISIIFFTYVNKKNHLWARNYAIIFFTPHVLKKPSCGSTSVKHSFLSSFIGVKKSLTSSK